MATHAFAGSGTLTRFIFRRDRVRLVVWLVALVGFAAGFVPVFETLIADGAGNRMMAEMMKNPAMVAIVGPVYGLENYHIGAVYANMMLLFSVMIAGVMNIFLVTRHTRQDEELGRLEVIRSLPVGRLANLASTLLAALVVNMVLSVMAGLGLYALREEGMLFSGCMLFGACLGAVGLFFAAATALFCQMTANNRTASALSFLLLLVLYMVRAVGDLGREALSLASPLGLILRAKVFVEDIWWPVWVVAGTAAALAAVAFVLARIRDLGRGLVPEKPGRAHASGLLSSAFGLALRLLRGSLIAWGVIIFVLAGMYGSILGDMEGFIAGNEILSAVFAANPQYSMTEQFVSMLMLVMTMIGTIPVLTYAQRAAGEEKSGYAEHVFGRAVSRREQLAAYTIPAFLMSVVLQALSALGFWLVGSFVLDAMPSLGTFIAAAFAYLPAMWVMLGIGLVLVAFFPGKTFVSFVYLAYCFLSVYIGTFVGFPDWTGKITPFGVVPQYPIEEMRVSVLVVETAIAVLLAAAAFWGCRRRDLQTQ